MIENKPVEDGRRQEGHRRHEAVGRVADAGEDARHAHRPEVRDLFAYPADVEPTPADRETPVGRKAPSRRRSCKVLLVSGSLEYKSDESLAEFQKYLEANYPVECVRAFRKTDKDICPGSNWRRATSRSSSPAG